MNDQATRLAIPPAFTDEAQKTPQGFNYGMGNTDLRPLEFFLAEQTARQLGEIAVAASRKAWELEMAIRNFRLAESAEAKRHTFAAMVELLKLRQQELTAVNPAPAAI